ncbi:hypothetical protein TcG_10829 [Trypanosoma cruzi]|nr:hypothetical protein TcG_10829 [Trypanosoma cruzi]
MSCCLSSTIMNATPNAYCRTCSMRRNHPRIRLAVMHCISLSLWLEQRHKSSQSTAWCCKRLTRGFTCVEFPYVREQLQPSLPQISPPFHTKGRCHGKGKSAAQRMHKSTRSSSAIQFALEQRGMRTYTHGRKEREMAHPTPRCWALLLSSSTDWHCVPHSQ